MADRTFDESETKDAFRYASSWWRSLVGAVEPHQWDEHGIGDWTVRELVVHADRAYRTVLEYLDGEAKDPTELATAAAYFRTVLGEETPHVHIAARAKREAVDVADPVAATDAAAEEAEDLVIRTPGEAIVHTFVGEIRLDQYLATRVVELVVHGIDLAEIIGIPTNPPPASASVALAVFADLVEAADQGVLLRALSGRAQMIPGLNVLD
ncbi:MAG TPA: maleylpyruvate isomerase N-terminal domain-containing protein [Acidimicrobiales bacterium]|jgi:hypothetical protein